ncbi:MAG: DUF4145 domain-containing protein [Pseudomonadota bacterium]
MFEDERFWRRSFEVLPNWPCPRCQQGSLKRSKDSEHIVEPHWSAVHHSDDEWESEWLEERFSIQMICQNASCGEVVSVIGKTSHELFHEPDWGQSVRRQFEPKAIYPAPPVFKIIDECPQVIAAELLNAFELYWSDSRSSANRLRAAAEAMLTERGVSRYSFDKKNKRYRLSLHARIERFEKKNAKAAEYLMAIKWLGNAGSHDGLDKLTDQDLLGGFELFEHVLETLYAGKTKKLDKIAKGLNKLK